MGDSGGPHRQGLEGLGDDAARSGKSAGVREDTMVRSCSRALAPRKTAPDLGRIDFRMDGLRVVA